MRNIKNINQINNHRDLTNGGDLNELTADLPLNIVEDPTGDSNDSINLGGLSSFGSAGQVIKVNSNANGLEYADDSNTSPSAQTPLVISNNVIGLNGISGYGSTIGQRLLIRTNANNTALEYFPQPDFITSVTQPLAISNTGVISLSNLTDLGTAGQIIKVNSSEDGLEYADEQDVSGFVTADSTTTFTNKSMSYDQLTSAPISNDGLSNTKLIQFRNSGSPARAIEFANSSGTYRHTVEHTNNGLQFYAGNSSSGINLTQILNISTTGLKIQRIEMIENTDSFNVLMFNSATGLIAKSRSTYVMPSSSGTLALTSDIPSIQVDPPLTIANNTITLSDLDGFGSAYQVLRVNSGNNGLIYSNETVRTAAAPLSISNDGVISLTGGTVTASSTTTFTNKSMSYGQVTSRPFDIFYNVNIAVALYQFLFRQDGGRCIMFSNSSEKYRHGISHTDTSLDFFMSNTNDGVNGTNKVLSIGLTAIKPSVDISLLAVGNSTGVSQIIKFNNDTFNTIGANFSTQVASVGGLEIKGYAAIENIISRTDTSDNMRTILASNVFQVLKGSNPSVNKTLLLLRDGASNSLGDVSNDLILLGKDLLVIGNNAIFLGTLTATGMYIVGTGVFLGNGTPVSSDDRIKFNETKISIPALETINKLVVVEYDKRYNRELPETEYGVPMERHLLDDTPQKEYGYIAQDTWNDIPELRFTIKGVDETIPENFDEDGRLIEDCKVRTTNPEGEEFIDRKYLSVDYNNINVLNVRAVQELSEIVKRQQAQIDRQQAQIEMLLKFNNLDIE